MLQSIRERAQGVVAWFIVVLISVPFALWGIQEYLGVGTETVVASVNDQEITEREFEKGYRDFRQSLRERLGKNYRPELLDEKELRQQVLEAMIRNSLVMQAADDLGLAASDEMVISTIRAIPAFQVAGVFNQDAYDRGVRLQGVNSAGFEAQIRSALVSEQLSKAIRESEFSTASEFEQLIRLRQQRRELGYLIVPASSYLDQVSISDDETKAHYEANKNSYLAPERVRIEYLDLDIDNIAKTLTADEQTLQGYYEQHKDEFVAAEQRRASHILFAVEEGAAESDVEAVREKALLTIARIKGGEDFAAVAKEVSEDPGSADQGGDLGFFEKGIMDPVFEEEAFALELDQVSELIRSSFGFHVIKLTGIRNAEASYEEMRDKVKTAYLRNEAERLFYEYAERMSDLAYEDPQSLEPAAEALGMKISKSDWFTRDGGEGVLAAPKVLGAAFSDEVLIQGMNSEALELAAEHMLVLRVINHEESSIRPYEAVEADIRQSLKADKAFELSRKKAGELVAELQAGAGLVAVAEREGLSQQLKGYIDRDNQEVPRELVEYLFSMPKPESGKASFGEVGFNGDMAVMALYGVKEGTLEQANELGGEAAITSALQRSRGEGYYQKFVQNLRNTGDISIIKKEE